MPESEAHPRRDVPREAEFPPNPPGAYVELGLASCFSFLRGASDAVELAVQGWSQGYDALGIADLNTLAGVVRMHVAAKRVNVRPVIGARLALVTGETFLAYPETRAAYGRLSVLLSKGKMRDPEGRWQKKGVCDITLEDLADHAGGLRLILVPPKDPAALEPALPRQQRRLPGLTHIAAARGEFHLAKEFDCFPRMFLPTFDQIGKSQTLGLTNFGPIVAIFKRGRFYAFDYGLPPCCIGLAPYPFPQLGNLIGGKQKTRMFFWCKQLRRDLSTKHQ